MSQYLTCRSCGSSVKAIAPGDPAENLGSATSRMANPFPCRWAVSACAMTVLSYVGTHRSQPTPHARGRIAGEFAAHSGHALPNTLTPLIKKPSVVVLTIADSLGQGFSVSRPVSLAGSIDLDIGLFPRFEVSPVEGWNAAFEAFLALRN